MATRVGASAFRVGPAVGPSTAVPGVPAEDTGKVDLLLLPQAVKARAHMSPAAIFFKQFPPMKARNRPWQVMLSRGFSGYAAGRAARIHPVFCGRKA